MLKGREIPVSEFRRRLSDVINYVAYAGERIILDRRGKKIAAVIPFGELEEREHPSPTGPGAWDRFKIRGAAIEQQNREHLRSLTPAAAVGELESLLHERPPANPTGRSAVPPLPTSISVLIKRAPGGPR